MTASPRFTVRQWLAALLPAVLLVAVAMNQVRLVHQSHLTPWKGGGFGMYSTIDSGSARTVEIIVSAGGARFPLDADRLSRDPLRGLAPLRIRWLAEQVRYSPTEEGLDAFADELVGTWLDSLGGPDTFPIDSSNRIDAVHITVWRYRYDPATREFTPTRWVSVQREAAP